MKTHEPISPCRSAQRLTIAPCIARLSTACHMLNEVGVRAVIKGILQCADVANGCDTWSMFSVFISNTVKNLLKSPRNFSFWCRFRHRVMRGRFKARRIFGYTIQCPQETLHHHKRHARCCSRIIPLSLCS